MIGQKGPGRYYPGETCWHTDENGRRDCKEPRWEKVTSKGPYRSTLCEQHDLERRRADGRASKKRCYDRKHGIKTVAEPDLRVWEVEKGKPAGECLTPGCVALKHKDASRCKACLSKQRNTTRPPKPERPVHESDEGTIARRVSSKPPVLPYSFRAFSWKGTLSEELRNSR